MKLKTVLKTIGTFVNKSKTTIVKHGPQIMAVAGAGCFIAGTYYAIKETPKAMAKLEAKKKLDPNMGKLQTVAVVAPEYKKTLACTAAGITFTGLSWRLEAKHVATLTAALSGALKEKDQLIEASKKVVGEEKTADILTKKEEIAEAEDKREATGSMPSDLITYEFRFPNGSKIWTTWKDFKQRRSDCVKDLSMDKKISVYDVMKMLGDENAPEDMHDIGWQILNPTSFMNASTLIDEADDLLDYRATLVAVENGDGLVDIPAYKIKWVYPFKPFTEGVSE